MEVPAWHPFVTRVIPVAVRRWRRNLSDCLFSNEIPRFRRQLRERSYDVVIDAQGLIKSAVLGFMAKGPVHGFARDSAREPTAALAYTHKHHVVWGEHAITRVRKLFAQVFGYPLPKQEPEYGLDVPRFQARHALPYVTFLHGTNWVSKQWPEAYWSQLAGIAVESGYEVRLPWGTSQERLRAERLVSLSPSRVRVLPRTSLSDLGVELVNARGVVGVDSGLVHLAAAFFHPVSNTIWRHRCQSYRDDGAKPDGVQDRVPLFALSQTPLSVRRPGRRVSAVLRATFSRGGVVQAPAIDGEIVGHMGKKLHIGCHVRSPDARCGLLMQYAG